MGRTVLGVERLDTVDDLLTGRSIALVTNAAATDSRLVSTVDLLASRYCLRALFGPEHGIRGDAAAGATVGSGMDARTGLPVYSLYGERRAPAPQQLEGVEAVVVDLPDVGSRYYTYLSTLVYVMEACTVARIPVVVLDRPNPLGGAVVEGTILDRRFASFVGRFPVPARHGLTIGEYADFINETEGIGCELHVAELADYDRVRYHDELDLAWVMPSPNLPSASSALAYVGTCLLEGTNVSEGRGTTKPFELFGAPWLDQDAFLGELAASAIAGALLRACWFTPNASKFTGELCAGFELHVVDRNAFRPYAAGVAIVDALRRSQSEFAFREPAKDRERAFIDLLSGDDTLRRPDFDLGRYLERCASDSARFSEGRRPFLRYA